MKFKTIEIENYKGISNVEIDFTHNRIITLVGLNESGKTTILQAIDFFKRICNGEEVEQQTLNQIRPKGIKFTGDVILKAIFEIEESDKAEIAEHLKENKKVSKILFPDTITIQLVFSYDKNAFIEHTKTEEFAAKSSKASDLLKKSNAPLHDFIVEFAISNLIPEVLYYEDFIFEIPDKIIFEPEKEGGDEEEQNNDDPKQEEWKSVLGDILYAVDNDFYDFQKFVVDLWASDNDTARQRISAMEKKLDKVITKAWKNLFNEEQSSKSSRLNFKEIKINPIQEQDGTLSFSFKIKTEGGKEFSINERSKGCKWFFSFLIFTEFRKKRSSNILFLLDEPASNLHSSAQLKILDAINSLIDESIIIYSTHSHHLINPIWLNGAYIVINEGISEEILEGSLSDFDAKITIERYFKYVSESKQNLQTLYFQPILDRLDYKPSFVEPVPNITICEGRYDWFTFKYVNEVLLANQFKLNFYPGKGKDNNLDIIRLYLAWGSNFLLILDGDEAGQESKSKTYVKEFGKILENKVFTLNDILNRAVPTELLFTSYDAEIICDEAFGKGTYQSVQNNEKLLKSKLNFAINQLYVNGTKVQLTQESLNNFVSLFEFISDKN